MTKIILLITLNQMVNPLNGILDNSFTTSFINDGYVKINNAFSPELTSRCRDVLWEMIIDANPTIDRHDRTSWPRSSDTEPFNVIRIEGSNNPVFAEAANSPKLHSAFDQLVGKDKWIPRTDMGSFPIPFPSSEPVADVGWHIDGCELIDGKYQLRFETDCRILLMLFLFSDVDDSNAPTLIRIGSHQLVAPILHANKGNYMTTDEVTDQIENLENLPIAKATGKAGDVYLCHPFLVHAGQLNLSSSPRFLGQPGLSPTEPLDVERNDDYKYSPVETSVRMSLGLI